MIELFYKLGIWTWIISFSFLFALVLSVISIILKNRILSVIMLIVCIIPFLIGLIGTIIGYVQLSQLITDVSTDIISEGKQTASLPVILGSIFSTPLLLFNIINNLILFKNKRN